MVPCILETVKVLAVTKVEVRFPVLSQLELLLWNQIRNGKSAAEPCFARSYPPCLAEKPSMEVLSFVMETAIVGPGAFLGKWLKVPFPQRDFQWFHQGCCRWILLPLCHRILLPLCCHFDSAIPGSSARDRTQLSEWNSPCLLRKLKLTGIL